MTVRVKGLDRLADAIERLKSEGVAPDGAVGESLELALLQFHRYATGIVHVDTGRLKNSLFVIPPERRSNTLIGYVATNVEYAPYEEARGGSHAFFRRTVNEEGPNLNNLFSAQVAEGLREQP